MSPKRAGGMAPELQAAIAEGLANGNGARPLRPRLPEFPVDVLPTPLSRFVRDLAEETQTPVDLAAGAVLAVCSTATLGIQVKVQEGWHEELALYVLVSLPSGERKSAVLRQADAPLRAIETERRVATAPGILRAKSEKDLLTAQREKVKRAKNTTAEELYDLDQQLAALVVPTEPVMLADDITPEVLATLINEQGGVGIISGESAILDNLAGRYSDGKANLHVVLKAYSGEPARVHRRDRVEHLDHPLLAIGITTQPHVLAEIVGNERMRDQGLLARHIILSPTSSLGNRRLDAATMPALVRGEYHATIRKLWLTPKASVLRFSPEARTTFRAFERSHEARLILDAGDLSPIADWAGRHPGRVVRIAGLLHLAEHDAGEHVSERSIGAAIEIGDCFIAHARAALDMGERSLIERLIAWATATPEGRFTVRDAHTILSNRRGPVAKVQALIDRAVAFGYVRALPAPAPKAKGGRPPSPTYEVIGSESANGDGSQSGEEGSA